ncbi:MAG: PH domain-containing protein [Gammaproteobacteria bacterium]|nr:PH domain-containing protein [Gammaproteobacteria bacterium]
MSHDDFAFEPVRGLPAALPAGERLLWQGQPDWRRLAIDAYHVRAVAGYFLLIAGWHLAGQLQADSSWFEGLRSLAPTFLIGAIACAILTTLAVLSARSTVFSITSGRIVLRQGIALPITMNVPFELIDAASVKRRKNGSGDLALRLRRDQRIGYLVNWPYVRPGHFNRPQACFRSLASVDAPATVLGDAVVRR